MEPRVLILTGYGINCDEETAFAFRSAGFGADIVHVNDLIAGKKLLENYHVLAFPGGFSYGDNLGSGNAFAQKVKSRLWEPVNRFVMDKKLIIGICNGFQIIANLGLVPALDKKYGERHVGLMRNDNDRYTCRWVDLKAQSDSVWLRNMDSFSVPIAHGEGKVVADAKTFERLKQNKQIALTYYQGSISTEQDLPYNPNGSTLDIAGLTDESGRVLGLMPHPERAMFFMQLPNWTRLKLEYKNQGKPIPNEGPGIHLFQNAYSYVKETFR